MRIMIPSIAHFIWLGEDFPWTHILALRSTSMQGGFHRIIFHHTDDITGCKWYRELERIPGVEVTKFDEEAHISSVSDNDDRLFRIYEKLDNAVAKANILRITTLLKYGGVYLDTDVVTIKPLNDLLTMGGIFCGTERIVFPFWVEESKEIMPKIKALLRAWTRDFFRRLPHGWRVFRLIERFYHEEVNTAIIGSEPDHPFLHYLLDWALKISPKLRARPHALGTHLFQKAVSAYAGNDIHLYADKFFYPLGPEISEHWFRKIPAPKLDHVLYPETRIVHWYSSVRTKYVIPVIDPSYIRINSSKQLFSALALPFIDEHN